MISKCPRCDQRIMNVHFEAHDPSVFTGGSSSYTATISPCGHAIGSVPIVWEVKLNSIEKQTNSLQNRLAQIESNLLQIISRIR